MSNSSSMKWEEVGSKKKPNGRPSAIPKMQTKEKKSDVKMPTIESLRIYYLIFIFLKSKSK